MYPATISQNAPRADERRRNPRHRASSIIYAQLGSENGGIVINLGIDGLAFHAAKPLTAERNSTLNLQLRGSGLNIDLAGELVWLGATQKEAGICFKNLSTKIQQEIAVWIARDAHLYDPVVSEDWTPPKPMRAMPKLRVAGEKSVPHSFSAGLAMSRAIPVDSPSEPSGEPVDAEKPGLLASLESAPLKLSATPLPAIVTSDQQATPPPDVLAGFLQVYKAGSTASQTEFQIQQPSPDDALFEPVPIDHPYQFPDYNSSPSVLSEQAMSPVREDLQEVPAAPARKSETRKAKKIEPISRISVSRPPDRLPEATAAEGWAPPELLAAWRRGSRQYKVVLAATATACVGIFALTLTLAVTHVHRSWGRPVGSVYVPQSTVRQSAQQSSAEQQSIAPAAAASANVEPPQTDPLPAPVPSAPQSAPSPSVNSAQSEPILAPSAQAPAIQSPPGAPAVAPTQSNPSATSTLTRLLYNVFGRDPDADREINDSQLRVQVWTSQSSGYYYCTDDAFYKTVQPGAFMAQGDALQSGYRPKLDEFCN